MAAPVTAAPAAGTHSGEGVQDRASGITATTLDSVAAALDAVAVNDGDAELPHALANPLDFVSQPNDLPPVPLDRASFSRTVSSTSDILDSRTVSPIGVVEHDNPPVNNDDDNLLDWGDGGDVDNTLLLPHIDPLSDAELVAALNSLNLLSEDDIDHGNNHHDNGDNWYNNDATRTIPDHPYALDFPDASEELPELEFTGDDDPLLASFREEQLDGEGEGNNDGNANDDSLWDVFDDESGDAGLELYDLEPLDPAADILNQLEGLSLSKEQLYAGSATAAAVVVDDEDETQSPTSWQEEPLPFMADETQLPQHQTGATTDSITAGQQQQHRALTDEDNDEWSSQLPLQDYYCQPCNDPASIPPTPYSYLLPYTEEQTWALAAAAVFAEQLEQQGEREATTSLEQEQDAAFWREQMQVLSSRDAASTMTPNATNAMAAAGAFGGYSPHPFDLLQDSADGGDVGVDSSNDTEPIPLSSELYPQPLEAAAEVQPHKPIAVRPGAREAAEPFVQAFGTSFFAPVNQESSATAKDAVQVADPKPKRRPPQRECFGHKERVLGCDISHCGRFLATASQDSTIRIWSMKTHRELDVLRGHSAEQECLRVAWASPNWAQDQIRRTARTDDHVQSYAYLVATGGADGVVHLWGCNDPATERFAIYATLDHSNFKHFVARSTAVLKGLPTVQEETDEVKETLDDDNPQIYSLQFIDHWQGLPSRSKPMGDDVGGGEVGDKTTNYGNSFLLTSSDEYVHLWELDDTKLSKKTKGVDGAISKQLHLREVLSLSFGHLNGPAYGVTVNPVTEECSFAHGELSQHTQSHPATGTSSDGGSDFRFGGERNVKNVIFVFDASYCPANGLLGAALSDGSLRLVNGRGVCLSVLQLPGCQSHLTSFSWDSSGEKLATTVATGHLILWGIHVIHSSVQSDHSSDCHNATSVAAAAANAAAGIKASCRAVLEGGHARGRPLYGSRFVAKDELLLSWGSDGRVCVWDSQSCDDEIDEPIAILWDNNGEKPGGEGYPVFALSLTGSVPANESTERTASASNESKSNYMLSIAIAGGGSTGGFLGIPVYLQDVFGLPSDDDDSLVQGSTKRAKKQDESS